MGSTLQNSISRVRTLREEVNGLVLGWELYHGNRSIASISPRVPERESDKFLFSSQVKEQFLKN
jgi:hypothetical protein